MKILLLGNRHFLFELLYNLRSLDFLDENIIDICVSNPPKFSLSQKIKNIKALPIKKIIPKIAEKIFLKIVKKQYGNSQNLILKQLFPTKNLTFLNLLPNVRFIKYQGLNKLNDISDYDLLVVASFSEKIPEYIYNQPLKGTVNIHSSLLPSFRGGNPCYIQAYRGNSQIATTIHLMADGWDNGDIISQKKAETNRELTSWDIFTGSAKMAAEMLDELHLNEFKFFPIKQDEAFASYCHYYPEPKFNIKNMEASDDIEGYVRANYLNYLFPFTYCFYGLSLLIIFKVIKLSEHNEYFQTNENIALLKKNKVFYLKFYNNFYIISHYCFRGKICELVKDKDFDNTMWASSVIA